VVEEICRCSNEYAEANKDKKPYAYKYYKSMTKEDFYKLVGLLVRFGYRKIPQYRLAWRCTSLCYDPFVVSVMSRNKFDSLLAFLHIVDQCTEEDLKKKSDKLAKVGDNSCILYGSLYTWCIIFAICLFCRLDHISSQCITLYLYQPNAEISIDERMVRSKARFSFKQYIKNKPTKWEFKLWVLCDSRTGYTNNFVIY